MNVSRSSPRGAAAEPAAKARATNAPMKGGWLAGAMAIALIGGGCEEGPPTGAELASEVALGPAEGEVSAEPVAEEPREPVPEEVEPPREEPSPPHGRPESITNVELTLEEGETRETAERLAGLVGAEITGEVEQFRYYVLTLDVETAEARDALMAQIAAESGVHDVRPTRPIPDNDRWRVHEPPNAGAPE